MTILPSTSNWQPPAIVIEWSEKTGCWRATAVVTADDRPIGVEGRASTGGHSPAHALDQLLGNSFGFLGSDSYAPTLISIDRGEA